MFSQELTLAAKSGSSSGWVLKVDPAAFRWTVGADGSLTLSIAPPGTTPKRIIGQVLPRSSDGTYSLPVGSKNPEIWVNGLHYWDLIDFNVSGSVLTPKPGAGNWAADADVRLNYEL